MKQIGVALHNYESSIGRLPPAAMFQPGVTVPNKHNVNFGPNWAVLLLPYIEQGNLYETAASSVANYMSNGDSGWRSIATTKVKVYLCPSDKFNQTAFTSKDGSMANWARGNYAANAGAAMFRTDGGGEAGIKVVNNSLTENTSDVNLGSNYAVTNVSGTGVMTANFSVAVENIPDGTSNTVLIDEIRAGTIASDPRGTWAMGQCGASINAGSGRADSPGPNSSLSGYDDIFEGHDDPANGMGAFVNSSQQVTMKSFHPGGAFAVFADGSVRFVKNSISRLNYQLIHSRDDGQVITDFGN